MVNELKRSQAESVQPEVVKTQFVENKFKRAVPFELMGRELVQNFKSDCKINRGPLLSGKRLEWVKRSLKEADPSEFVIEDRDVILALKSLKNSCAAGLDKLKPKLLPTNSSIFIKVLSNVIKKAFRDCWFPAEMKKGKLSFFTKPSKASKSCLQVGDFRGITLCFLFLKIIDHIIKNRATDIIESKNLRPQHQGFRPNRGVVDLFAFFMSQTRVNLEKRVVTALLMVDLSSAYNRIDHWLLFEKLLIAGFPAQMVKFVKYWISDRRLYYKQFVILLGVSALPQGSPASPVLFCVYCDFCLAEGESNTFFLVYADDSSFHVSGRTWAEVDAKINHLMQVFGAWCRGNGLTLSPKKTEILFIHRIKKSPFRNLKQYEKEHCRYLGLFIDKHFTFRYHIECVLKSKINCLLYAFKIINKFVRMKTRRAILFSMLQNLFWPLFYIVQISQHLKQQLVTMYNKLCRACAKVGFFVDMNSVRSIIGIESFDELLTRLLTTKIVTVDARYEYYKQNGIESSLDHSKQFYTPFINEIVRPLRVMPSRGGRPTRQANPYRLAANFVQNESHTIVSSVLEFGELPWRLNPTFFEGEDWRSIRTVAREQVNHLGLKRRDIIRESLYTQQLKDLPTLYDENCAIAQYCENRRDSWNFVPQELWNNVFQIR